MIDSVHIRTLERKLQDVLICYMQAYFCPEANILNEKNSKEKNETNSLGINAMFR